MSTIPPPPIKSWSDIPPVWQRWFMSIYNQRVGGADAAGIDELEERIACIPERTGVEALEARVAALEAQLASIAAPKIGELTARVDDLERSLHA